MIALFLSSLTHAFQPDFAPYIGVEPVRYRKFHIEQQHLLRKQEIWKKFRDTTGWFLQFDEKTGEIFRGKGKGIILPQEISIERGIQSFLQEHEWYHPKDLLLLHEHTNSNDTIDARYVHFSQQVEVSLEDDINSNFLERVPVWRGGVDALKG